MLLTAGLERHSAEEGMPLQERIQPRAADYAFANPPYVLWTIATIQKEHTATASVGSQTTEPSDAT